MSGISNDLKRLIDKYDIYAQYDEDNNELIMDDNDDDCNSDYDVVLNTYEDGKFEIRKVHKTHKKLSSDSDSTDDDFELLDLILYGNYIKTLIG